MSFLGKHSLNKAQPDGFLWVLCVYLYNSPLRIVTFPGHIVPVNQILPPSIVRLQYTNLPPAARSSASPCWLQPPNSSQSANQPSSNHNSNLPSTLMVIISVIPDSPDDSGKGSMYIPEPVLLDSTVCVALAPQ